MMEKFKKKPVVIDAVQWDGTLEMASRLAQLTTDKYKFTFNADTRSLHIGTLEGKMRADVNDWIIRGVAGEFYPCKPDIFTQTYEKV